MFRLLLALVIVAVSFLCAADALTNASIVKMVQDKISHDLIILAIKHDQVHFNIDSDSIALLTEVGVPEDVIEAMVVKQSDLDREALTNASIVKLVQDKISHDLIILAIKHDQVHFNIDSDSIALLTEVGVPEDVIEAMVVKQSDLVPFNQPTYSEDNSLGAQIGREQAAALQKWREAHPEVKGHEPQDTSQEHESKAANVAIK